VRISRQAGIARHARRSVLAGWAIVPTACTPLGESDRLRSPICQNSGTGLRRGTRVTVCVMREAAMTDPWELICHHTYSGTPGVVFDHSPSHLSHGEAVGIGPAAFSQNGATPGSGAVRIGQDGERIRVPQSSCWSPLVGLKAEVTVRLDSDTAGLALHLGGVWSGGCCPASGSISWSRDRTWQPRLPGRVCRVPQTSLRRC
jgi:hypothetical protein